MLTVMVDIQSCCCPLMMWGILFSQPGSTRSSQLLSGSLWALPSCWLPAACPPACIHSFSGQGLILQSFRLGWFALIVKPVYHSMSWGLTGLRSPSNELRSEGNIQHSCAYSEGRGQERRAAALSGTGQVSPLKLSSESLFAFIKMFAWMRK